jgi:hypothetical protein
MSDGGKREYGALSVIYTGENTGAAVCRAAQAKRHKNAQHGSPRII